MKGYLQQKKIAFRSIDVSQDPEAPALLEKLAGRAVVPVTTVGEQVVVGFDRARLESLLL